MDNEARRITFALVVALGVFFAYQWAAAKFFPPHPTTTQPVAVETPAEAPPVTPQAAQTTTPATTAASAPAARIYTLSSSESIEPLEVGGRDGDALRLVFRPQGAALASVHLLARDGKGHLRFRTKPHEDNPYQLLHPVDDGQRERYSFATNRLWIEQRGDEAWNQSWSLDTLVWAVAEQSPERVAFTTTLGSGEPGGELLRLTKRFALRPGKPVVELDLVIENVSGTPLRARVEQDGPLGVGEENEQYDMRRLLTAQRGSKGVELNRARQHEELRKAAADPNVGYLALSQPEDGPVVWTALANKYFAVFTRPVPLAGGDPDYVAVVNGLVAAPHVTAAPNDLKARGDLLARFVTKPTAVPPGGQARFPFEIYAGPKDAENAGAADPAYGDPQKLYYQVVKSADITCFCGFLWLEELMLWLLDKIQLAVRNYGIAIIILVVIVRSLLHPLSVWQQKSMFRTQEAMARVQPKLNAIKTKFPNDKVKQNQETMKLFHDEGVNPAGGFVSLLPMFLQMPILVALWSGLNTDIHLRHAPFDGWWIVDLSAPDALLRFDPPVTVPIIGWLPLIGSVFSGITSLNLLPLLLALVMWLQQKYMPKPQSAARQPAAPGPGGMSAEDQLRQQKIMMYMMVVLFPLMFYKMPSGLNLYWFASNIFGIAESLIIRKQINEERERLAREGPRPRGPKPPGLVGRFFKRIASQAEELQRKADDLAKTEATKRERERRK
jgi:YidC/Oxa1 family membrane protein insertase